MAEPQMISAVASSSDSSSVVSSKKYDVFLSFQGEDTLRNFASHLHEALKQMKVETYIDDRLEKGDEISPALIKAIEDSHVSVVILSEKYTSSKWCLDELRKILECKKEKGQIVIPVLYNIDPSHVRMQTGSCEQAFAKHEGEPRCNKWKAALTEVANLAGWDSRTYRMESELLKDIVRGILQKLPPRYPTELGRLVGIETNYEHIESLLNIGSSEIRVLGIWGMGGIGKTALATVLYAKLSHKFDVSCFLANVRAESDKHGHKALRNKLFSALENENHCFDAPHVVSDFDISRLCRKVFLVLDDVATSEQLKNIIDYDFLGPGSRVIITTRNKQILSLADIIYPVQDLSFHHSLQLFCLTVFGEKQPKDGYEDLSRRVISYCKGIPLALKFLGASLRSRSKEAWECELRKLQMIPIMEIHKVLKFSYDGLDHSEQDIFLDIACFFKGSTIDYVTRVLEAFNFFPAAGIKVLLDKALITVSQYNQIEMHDLIQQMGWEIVYQECIKNPGRRSRLWKHEEVHDILRYNMGTDVVEGIILDLSKLTRDLYLSSDSLAKMTKLRFLQIRGGFNRFKVYLPNGLESLSDKLKYIHWDECCLESLPSNFCAEQLVELHMCGSNLKKLWDGVQNLVNLKQIDVRGSRDLIGIPDLSRAEKLESVYLGYCESLRQLHVHSRSLCILELNCCSSLRKFSVTSEKMTLLDLRGTNFESLPASIKRLSMLRKLQLDDCRKLASLPEFPTSLEEVSAFNCISLETVMIQRLVLEHMLQRLIPYIHKHHLNREYYNYFMLPGDHVNDMYGFLMAESLITIPYLPKPHLCGFIYCTVLSKGASLDGWVSCSIYQDGILVSENSRSIECKNLISDHVLFWYHDISYLYGKSVVYDHFSSVPFKFEFRCKPGHYQERIKGCGVFPVYASASELKLVNSSSKKIFESESITKISDNEIGIRVGSSNNENEEDKEQLPTRKRRAVP